VHSQIVSTVAVYSKRTDRIFCVWIQQWLYIVNVSFLIFCQVACFGDQPGFVEQLMQCTVTLLVIAGVGVTGYMSFEGLNVQEALYLSLATVTTVGMCMHVCMHACMYVCMHACIYIHTYAYVYVHTHTHTQDTAT
jgi:hypothetical protein